MPLYDISFADGHSEEMFRSIAHFADALPDCSRCGLPMQRVICAPMIKNSEIYDYVSVLDSEHVTSRAQHVEHMRKHNVIEVGNEVPKPAEEKHFDWKSAIGETYAELKVTGKIDD